MSHFRRLASFAAAALALCTVSLHANLGIPFQTQLGNPSNAATDVGTPNNYLLERSQYVLSYHNANKEANWVSWSFTPSDRGGVSRTDAFAADPLLPSGFNVVNQTSYSGSGYDRGHMSPSADRTLTVDDNKATFFMTNMIPQAPDNNQGVWNNFEQYTRDQAALGNECLIISGPSGFSGSTIASGVAIPGYTWKIVVVVPNGEGTALSRINASTRVIAIKVPNTAGVRSTPWANFVTSARQIQTDTGFSFFTTITDESLRNTLLDKVDGQTASGAPTITVQPSAQTAAVGGSATFTVTANANGNPPLSYQWLKDGDALDDATAASLTLTGVDADDLGSYSVTVTNPVASVTSNAVALVVTGLPASIAGQPVAQAAAAGAAVTFSVTAGGSPPFTYQWRKAGETPVDLVNGGNVSGANSATLTLTNVQAADAVSYDVVVNNAVNTPATSSAVPLTVNPAAPTFVSQPSSTTAPPGGSATFTAVVSGSASGLAYQWFKDTTPVVDGANVTGAQSPALTLSNLVLGDAGNYSLQVTNSVGGPVASNTVTLNVSATSTVAWTFGAGVGTETAAPTSGLPADVTGGTVTQGNNNGTTTLVTNQSVSGTSYTGASSGNNAGLAARIGALSKSANGSAYFEITFTPATGKQLTISDVNFGSRRTGTGPLSYSIFTSVDNYATAVATGTFPNNTNWSLHTPAFTSATGGANAAVSLRIYGYGGSGSAGAGTANWRIDDLEVVVSTATASPAVASTTPASGAAAVTPTLPVSVVFNQPVTVSGAWFSIASAANGPIAATVTASGDAQTYTLTPPLAFADNDTITVTLFAAQIVDQATGTLHPAANHTFSFTTAAALPATLSTPPTAQTVAAGDTATFTVVASGTPPFTYQWRKGATPIAGNTSAATATLTIPNAQEADAASDYNVVVSNGIGSPATSGNVALTVTPAAPTIVTHPQPATVVAGGTATFSVVAKGTTPLSYLWKKDGGVIPDNASASTATLTIANVQSVAAGTYTVQVTNPVSPTVGATSNGAALAIGAANDAVQIAYVGGTYAQDFNGLPSTGTFTLTGNGPFALGVAAPNGVGATGLAGWSLVKSDGSGADAKFTVNDGASNSGAVYSYGTGTATDRALGSLASGSTVSRFGLSLVNNTGQTITQFTLGYTGEQWRRGNGAANALAFEYGLGVTGVDALTGFTAATALDFTAPVAEGSDTALDGNATGNRSASPVSATVTGLSWAPGQTLVLRWSDINNSGNDDGLAIDDLTFSTGIAAPTAPAVASTSPASNATAVAVTSPITVTFDKAVNVTGSWFTITSALNGAVAATVTGGPTTYTLTPAASFALSDTITVKVLAAQVKESTNTLNLAADYTFSFGTTVPLPTAFTAGNIVVERLGDGVATLNASAAVVAALEFSPTGGSPVQTITFPAAGTAPASAPFNLTDAGSATSNGYLNRSSNGAFITVPGYNAAPGTASVAGSSGATIARTIGTLAPDGTKATPLAVNVFSSNNFRSVVSNGTHYWASGGNGLAYITSTGTVTSIYSGNARNIGIFNNTLYVSSGSTTFNGSGSSLGIWRMGAEGTLPTATTTATLLFSPGTGSSSYGFAISPDGTWAYVADDRNTAAGGIQKWHTDGTTWTLQYTLGTGANNVGARGLAVDFTAFDSTTGAGAKIFATTSESSGANRLIYFASDSGSSVTPTVVANSGANYVFRGAALAPIPLVAPVITAQPVAQDVTVGGSATFSVTATGTAPLTYQWRKNGDDIADGEGVSGTKTATLTLTGITTDDAGNYYCLVTNEVTSTPSDGAALTVNKATATVALSGLAQIFNGTPRPVSVTTTPADLAVTVTYNDSSTVPSAIGSYTVVATVIDANFIGTATNTLVISPAAPTEVAVSLSGLNVVYDGTPKAVTVSTTPTASTSVTYGGSATVPTDVGTYAVVATVTQSGFTGSTTGTLTIAKAPQTIAFAGPGEKTATSAPFTLEATSSAHLAVAFEFVSGPASLSGNTVTLSGVAGTVVVRAIQPGNANISAATPVQRSFAVTSISAPVIVTQPVSQTVNAGANVTFSVVATGTPTLTYQWRKDGEAISGATGSSLVLSHVMSARAGVYSVVVSNAGGSVLSDEAVLGVIRGRFAGVYFGTLGNGGTFALHINDDHTGIFLGFAPGSRTAYLSRAITVNEDGSFSFTTTTLGGSASPAGAPFVAALRAADVDADTQPFVAAAAGDIVFQGTISLGGVLSGSSTSGGISMAANRSVDGATDDSAGFYEAGAAGSSAQALIIISPSGQAFVLIQSGSTVDSGTGTVDADGRITITTSSLQTISGTITSDTLAATVTNSQGTATNYAALSNDADPAVLQAQRFVNVSTRAAVGTGDQVAIGGFVITGVEAKTVLIRAVGPSLRPYGVATALAAPRLHVFRGSTQIATNTGWTTAANVADITAAVARTGAFPLAAGSADSVVLASLQPGNYTGIVSSTTTTTGPVLLEVYELAGDSLAQRLVNLSMRAAVGTGDNSLIAGLVIGGSVPKRVLIRAAGPALTQFGITDALARPQLTLRAANGTVIAQNAIWSTSADATAIAEATARTGAFGFGATSNDAAIVLNLAPGNYTAQVTSVTGSSGTALVEIYELP